MPGISGKVCADEPPPGSRFAWRRLLIIKSAIMSLKELYKKYPDKFWHIGALVIITCCAYPFLGYLTSLALGVAVAVGKEILDKYTGGCSSLADIAADGVGIGIATLIISAYSGVSGGFTW